MRPGESQSHSAPAGWSFPSPSARRYRDSRRPGPSRTTLAAIREACLFLLAGMVLAGPVVGNQPVDHILMDLDLSLLDQHILHAAFKQGVAVARPLALDLIAD